MSPQRPPRAAAAGRKPKPPAPRRAGPPGPAKEPPGLWSRIAAATLLWRVLDEGLFLDAAMERERARLDRLSPRDRAFVQRLLRETLRRLGEIDAIIDARLEQPLAEEAGPARHALRLATAETRFLGGKAHAAVDCAVALAKRGAPRFAPLVNAVARRIAERGLVEASDTDPATALDVGTPSWLALRLVADWGRETAEAIASAHLLEPPLDLTPRAPDRMAAAALATRLSGVATPSGSVRLVDAGPVPEIDGYEAGRWWVQDAAAAIPARLLGATPGARVVDLCAAPGGKTLQLAATGAQVTAVDLSAARMRIVAENLKRVRLNAEIVAADALVWRPAVPVDAVLLDAPCSATGTIRRHPDLQHVKTGDGIAALETLQDRLIDAAWEMLRPGGRLVFCTCSLLRSEGEERIAAALGRLPGARLDPIAPEEIGAGAAMAEFCREGGMFRSLPAQWREIGGLDGFFAARLVKDAPRTAEAEAAAEETD